MFVSVLERQRAILEDKCHHKVVWQRYCRKLTFWACRRGGGGVEVFLEANIANLLFLRSKVYFGL